MGSGLTRLGRAASLLAVAVLAACGQAEAPEATQKKVDPHDVIQVADVGTVPIPAFDRRNFSNPTKIDNPLSPLVPGTRYVHKGEANRGEGVQDHQVVQVVTDVTKVVNGIRTVVVWERDINSGEVVEAEIAFYAQDDDGNVWLVGEYPEEYEDGQFQGAPSTWLAGLAGARAGVFMPAELTLGTPVYIQGLAPDVDFQDVAKVHEVGREVCVPAGCFKDVTVIDEWDPLAQPKDGHALKFQAPGYGTVRVEPVGGEEQEVLVLEASGTLTPEELAEARAEALKLDAHAYKANARYADTPPAEGP
jgi:hypothetical protein